ncbi:hypothetical protein N657DRAFT_569661, partial [Parathielavia appendiculata]
KDLLPDGSDTPWRDEDQDKFSNYMSKVVDSWRGVTERAVGRLFYGKKLDGQTNHKLTDAELNTLYNLISDGKLVNGMWPQGVERPQQINATEELTANIKKTFFGFAIPALWRVSRSYAFVLDSGFGCDADKPLDKYLLDATMEATGACVDGRRYYLVHPAGQAFTCLETCWDNMFSAPPGIERLADFGDITKEDLIRGSVRTWMANGKRNGGGFPDTSDQGTAHALMSVDITTPGFVRLPVCSPEVAFRGWEKGGHAPTANYPCDAPLGRNSCGDSSFEDQTSAASPSVDDCLGIIRNIEGDPDTSWNVIIGHGHSTIASAGGCAFGVEPTWTGDNLYFSVGGQDVIDLINDAVGRFGGSGKVGAKGYMDRQGTSLHKPWHGVLWGIYSV